MPFAMMYYNRLQLTENMSINIGACRNNYDVMSCRPRPHYMAVIAVLTENSFLQSCQQLDNTAKRRCHEGLHMVHVTEKFPLYRHVTFWSTDQSTVAHTGVADTAYGFCTEHT